MNETEWLADLEAKADAATPGPWEDFSNHPDHIAGSVCKGERGTCLVCGKKGTVTWLEEDNTVHDVGMCGMCTFGSAEDDDYHTWAWGSINIKTQEVTPV